MIISGNNIGNINPIKYKSNKPNNNPLNMVVSKINNQGVSLEENTKNRIDSLSLNLRNSIKAREDIQDNISYLQEKEESINTILEDFKLISSLADKYNSQSLNDEDREEIINQAREKLINVKEYMDGLDKDKLSSKVDVINLSSGENILATSNKVNINFKFNDRDNSQNNNLINIDTESQRGIENILRNNRVIREEIISPLKESLEEVNRNKSKLYSAFLGEQYVGKSIEEELDKYKLPLDYINGVLNKINQSIKVNRDLGVQSNRLEGYRVGALLK
ncbi:MAG: hypothetical protein RR840_01000 [Clostridium sp.]